MDQNKKIKKVLYSILNKKHGRRFLYAYVKINFYINKNRVIKTILFLVGVSLIFAGIILLFIPGPGIFLMLIGGALLCVVSKKIAVWFDKLEEKIRKIFKR